jgi:hypothetical protein
VTAAVNSVCGLCHDARVGEPDAGNLHVRFDEGEQRYRCSLLDILRFFELAVGSFSRRLNSVRRSMDRVEY